MAAHRFWALVLGARAGSGNGVAVAVAEVQMRATSGGADQCTGGTASGASSGGYVAANAFDDAAGTLWYNGAVGLGVRLSYEFAAPVNVTEVHLTLPDGAAPYPGVTYGPAAVWVQWSDDGTTWRYGSGTTDLSDLGNGAAQALTVSDVEPSATVTALAVPRLVGVTSASVGRLAGGRTLVHRPDVDGAYSISGTVAIDGTPVAPVSRRVRLFDQMTGALVREVWSDAVTGAFAFDGLAARKYLVVTQDHTLLYDPVARAEVVPA